MIVRVVCLVLAAALFAGCAGGQTESTLPTRVGTAAAKTGKARIHIRIPRKHPQGRVLVKGHGKRPHYVAADTKSMQLQFKGPTPYSALVVLDPTATGSNCGKQASGDYVCSLDIALAPGTYSASITTYDGTNPVTANVLSAAQDVGFAVTAGAYTQVVLTLAGVPANVVPVLLSDSLTDPVPVAGGIELEFYGIGPHTFGLAAEDADNETIVGPGSPAITVSSSSSAFQIEPSPPPGEVVILPDTEIGSTATLTFTASYAGQTTDGCAQPGAVCTSQFPAGLTPLIAVGNAGNGTISMYCTCAEGPVMTISLGAGSSPAALTYDYIGDIDYADGGLGEAATFSFPYSSGPLFVYGPIVNPVAVGIDQDQNLYVLDNKTDHVLVYPFGTTTPVATLEAGSGASSMIVDFESDVIVGNKLGNSVSIFTPSHTAGHPYTGLTAPPYTLTTGVSTPLALAIDSTYLYVANATTVKEYSLASLTSNVAPAVTITSGINVPTAMAIDSTDPLRSDYLFVANQGASTVTVYKPAATSAFETISSGISIPTAMAFDGTGDLFVTNSGNNSLTEYAVGTTTAPTTFTSGISNPESVVVIP
jgi:hypothetical protein